MNDLLKAGDTFTHRRDCDIYRPIYYAGASGDFNPIHIDPQAGAQAGLGGVILQGLCTLAWCAEALTRQLEDPGKVRRIKVRFSRPVRPGDQIRFEGKITAVADGRLAAEIAATNQRGEDVLKGAVLEAAVDPG